jgi:hypothetical protein
MSLSTLNFHPVDASAALHFCRFPGLPGRDTKLHPSAILHQYEHFQQLFDAVQQEAQAHGFAAVKRRSKSDPKTKKAIKIDIACTCGQKPKPRAKGYRENGTTKTDCRWKGIARLHKESGFWSFHVAVADHNHGPSSLPANIPANRRRHLPAIEAEIYNLGSSLKLSYTDIAATVMRAHEGLILTGQDVSNTLRKKRETDAGGLTPTQQFLDILESDDDAVVKKRINPETGRIDAMFWTYESQLALWHRNPGLLSMDNTYKVNRFNLPLFQVTGTTCTHSSFNIAFGLVSKEDETTYSWVLGQLDALRVAREIDPPHAIITDFDKGLKNAVSTTFQEVQQMLCRWHIMKNVVHNIKKKWHGGNLDGQAIMGNAADPAPDLPSSTAGPATDESDMPLPQVPSPDEDPATAKLADAAVNRWIESDEADGRHATKLLAPQDRGEAADALPNGRPIQGPQAQPSPQSNRKYTADADGILLAWKTVVYSSTEPLFWSNWALLKKEFPEQQGMVFPSKCGSF